MGTTTPTGYPYPEPTDPVADGAAAIKALADKIEAVGLVRAAHAIKPADQTGIASGANAGFTATLPNVRAGNIVIGVIIHNGAFGSGATSAFMTPAWTGVAGAPGSVAAGPATSTTAAANVVIPYFAAGVANGGNVTLTYSFTQSNASAYSVVGSRSSITLIALPANGALGLLSDLVDAAAVPA